MINKYHEFLLESSLYKIFDAYVYGSADFISRLKIISSQNKGTMVATISDNIIDLIGNFWINDEDVKQNYFDLTDKDDMVTFVNNDKVPDEDESRNTAYLGKRNEIKIGKVVKYLSSLEPKGAYAIGYNGWSDGKPNNKNIEDFVNAFKSTNVSATEQFKLVKGDDISKYYNRKKYQSDAGTLGNSCMAHKDNSYFKLYSNNPKKVRMLIYVDENDLILGRALVWKVKDSPCESKIFMDRVYTINDSIVNKFINFAKENDWFFKYRMSYDDKDNVKFIYKDQVVMGEVKVKLNADLYKFPFLDTLSYLNENKTMISNLPEKECYELHYTDGDYQVCDECEGEMYIDDEDNNRRVLCDSCCLGHLELLDNGIATKLNKKRYKKL